MATEIIGDRTRMKQEGKSDESGQIKQIELGRIWMNSDKFMWMDARSDEVKMKSWGSLDEVVKKSDKIGRMS